MKKNEFKVTSLKVTEVEDSGEERPVSLMRVRVTSVLRDPIEFVLDPPEALELADKLRVMALKLGR
jgi:hypothetical protein